MNLRVYHQLNYQYSDTIFLEPHLIYLHPKALPHQQIVSYQLRLSPEPNMVAANVDAEGNLQHIAYFSEMTNHLIVTAEIEILSNPFNVFDFVIFPFEAKQLPFQYPESVRKSLHVYTVREGVTTYVEQFARQTAASAKWQTVPFLTALCKHISQNFMYEVREFGPPLPPEHTLINQKGSCRDFAQLFIACCRSLGLAARFVSGYLYGSNLQAHELHAWAEVYLPGAGWRGFDPTEGKAIVNNHIYLACAADPRTVAPVAGAFRGKARSSLTTEVNVSEWVKE